MPDESLSRRIASAVLSALKSEGHILVARGEIEGVVREVDQILATPLPRIVARASRGFISGEVTSTFGDEATDEAVEAMVEEIREAVVESDHVEDVFAEDRELERFIFRVLRDQLLEAARTEEDDAEETVPISVRLDTLGYVAATAARSADEATVRAALERAARQADGALQSFEAKSRLALFAMPSEDPDHRLEVEEAVAEELTSLVTEGAVVLPTVDRRIALGRDLLPEAWRALRPRVDMVAKRLLVATGVPSSWRPEAGGTIRLSFTPLSEKDTELVDEITAAFQKDVRGLLGRDAEPDDEDEDEDAPAARSSRGGPATRRSPTGAPEEASPKSAPPKSAPPKATKTKSVAPKAKAASKSIAPKAKSVAPKAKSDAPKSAPPKAAKTKSDAPKGDPKRTASDKPPTSKRR